jgi:hypothetical protein
MKIRLTEDQIARIKANLKENHLNEDYLDDLLSKGGSFVNKSVSAVKDFIAGLDVPVLKKQEDVPETADFVGDNVEDFFKILKGINSPITEQKLGEMVHQQGVEAVQIGLQILGYEMPRFGTDGLFGPETAAAINKYKSDKNLTESILGYFRKSQLLEMNMVTLKSTSYSNVKFDNDATKNDTVNQALLDDINKAGAAVGVVATITTARANHNYLTTTGNVSRHNFGIAVDIGILNGISTNATNGVNGNKQFRELGNALKDALVALGYVWNSESGNPKAVLWQTYTGGNHYNHLHVSNKAGASDADLAAGIGVAGATVITVEMVAQLVKDLEARGVTSEDLKKYIDPAISTGGGAAFTNLDLNTIEGKEAYAKICQNYIDYRDPTAEVTGEMLADGAVYAFKTFRKYVPPELALAQLTLEGGIDSPADSVPMRTKNPFNVGNTGKKENPQASFEDGVKLYYSLIARRYLVGGKTASDLVNEFKNADGNSYAEAGTYEAGLKSLLNSIKKRNAPIYAALAQKSTSTVTESVLLEADKRQAITRAFRLNDAWANEFHQISDKLSIWIAETFINKMVNEYGNQAPAIDSESNVKMATGASGVAIDPKRKFIINLLNQASPTSRSGLGSFWANDYKSKYEYIMHWIRAPRREQLNIRELTFDDAYAQAQEWHDSLSYKSESNFKEEGDVFIDYRNSDGQGYYWVHLHKNYCSSEADRMGHCARSNNGELISFRRINEFGEGASLLTVDYRPGGIIGDFHRHGNNKPTARFHPQIIDFLVNTTYPVTQLTRDRVHRYEDNFQLADLTPAQKESVYERNPSLKYNINDPDSIVNIVNAVIDGEININQYRGADLVKLIKKAKTINKTDEFKTLINKETVISFYNNPSREGKDNVAFFSVFSNEINEYLIGKINEEKARGNGMHMFQDILRNISQNFFDAYQSFCGVIDFGFNEFPDKHAEILGGRAIKRTILSCTDSVEFLQRYVDNKPTDKNGYMAVKTEEGLWGLVNKAGDNVLLPAFYGIVINPRDRSGKTYQVVNASNDMFIVNIESGDIKKLPRK